MTDGILAPRPVHAVLADGTTVCIRPVAPDDHEQLREFYKKIQYSSADAMRSDHGSPEERANQQVKTTRE
jgi:hypothetical protein